MKLYTFLILILLALAGTSCARSASSEEMAPESPDTIRTRTLAQRPGPSATATNTAGTANNTPLAQPLDPSATPTATATGTATATATPTDTPAPTLVPPTSAAIAECPVSLPNLEESPNDYYISTRSGFGNPTRTMFIGVWPGGKVFFHPGGPGVQSPDGSLGMKFWFYRTVPGDVTISGERLDAPAPPMPRTVLRGAEDGYGETGFHPAGLIFPGEGCWEVTARAGDEEMRVVMLVVRLSLEPFRPVWLPDGIIRLDTDLSRYPHAIGEIYGPQNGETGQLIIETSQNIWDVMDYYHHPASQDFVVVNGHKGLCVLGAPDEAGEWQENADAGTLVWRKGYLTYRIQHQDLGLDCPELVRVAGATPSSHTVPTVTAVPPVATPLPSDPPSTCPVTQPPDPEFDPPGKPVEVFPGKFWYGSDDLYLALPLDGAWRQLAKGDKVFWWSIHYPGGREENFPNMTIHGRRLDEPGQTFKQFGATNASHHSFPATAMRHGLRVPAGGCWEITGEYRGESLSFVVWVP